MTNIYDALIENITENLIIKKQSIIGSWVVTELSNGNIGCCSRISDDMPKIEVVGKQVKDVAKLILSELPSETVCGLSAINAFYNTTERLNKLKCESVKEAFCTDNIDISGKKIGMLGHMSRTAEHIRKHSELFIFEFNPKPGDYPADEEENILPDCDIIIMSGTTISNHTLENVLRISPNAQHILLGPSVPLCNKISGIDRLSGNIISNRNGFLNNVDTNKRFPIQYAKSFNLDIN